MNEKQNYLQGAAILAVGVVVMKLLGAIYKIPLGTILGDSGYTYFLVAYTLFDALQAVATTGLPIALSRMVSEANTQGDKQGQRSIFRVALVSFAVFGGVATLCMAVFPDQIATLMGEPQAAESIFALSPAVLLVCLVSAYRGYTQGLRNMVPTTLSQIIEIVIKVVIGLGLSIYLVAQGNTLAQVSAGAIFGTVVGCAVALLYMMVVKARMEHASAAIDGQNKSQKNRVIFSKLLRLGVPITLGASVVSLMTLVDTAIVLNRLQSAAGFTQELSSTLYGVYGKTLALYQLAVAFITPLTISLIPAISGALVRGDRKEAAGVTASSIRIAALVVMPMGIGLSVLAQPIMATLYPDSHESGSGILLLMGIAAILVGVTLITNAILQAHGKERYPVYALLVGCVVKLTISWVLVGQPQVHIYGAPIGTVACYGVICLLNIGCMRRFVSPRPALLPIFLRPLMSSLGMGVVAWVVYQGASFLVGNHLSGWLATAIPLGVAVMVACVAYLVFVVVTKALTYEDLALLPKGTAVANLLRIAPANQNKEGHV